MTVAPIGKSPASPRPVPGFAARLRTETRREHEEAERSEFVRTLLDGRLSRDGFAALTAQLYFIYDALERATEAVRDDPLAGAFAFAELVREPELATDLELLMGPGWRSDITPSPATARYVRRLDELAAWWPSGIVAHHYTRYLGDLSGGQAIGRLARRHYHLRRDGVRFYTFERIPKPKLFKDRYRELLDTTAWSAHERNRLVEEARLAFRLNTAVFADLGHDLDRYLAAS